MAKNRVLILLDGSEFRKKILPHVVRFLSPEQNELLLFRVGGRPQSIHMAEEPIMILDIFDEEAEVALASQLRDEMQSTKDLLEEEGYEVRREVRVGNVAHEIVTFIEEEQIQLVAMTTYGRTGLSKLLYGSIAHHVLQNVTIPIMLLRPNA